MPLLTMRLFAEEKKQGTIELLLTYPVRDLAAVLAKFAACLAVYTLMLASRRCIRSCYIFASRGRPDSRLVSGLFLLGAAFIALGALASSLTENQIVAGAISFGSCCCSGSSAGPRNSPAEAPDGCSRACRSWNTSTASPRGSSIPGTWCFTSTSSCFSCI